MDMNQTMSPEGREYISCFECPWKATVIEHHKGNHNKSQN